MATPTCEDSELPAGSNSCHGYLPTVSWEINHTPRALLQNSLRSDVEKSSGAFVWLKEGSVHVFTWFSRQKAPSRNRYVEPKAALNMHGEKRLCKTRSLKLQLIAFFK